MRGLERRATQLRELTSIRARELDLVKFELDEIEAADLHADEELELTAERDRLRHLEALQGAAAAGAEAISPESGSGVRELLARAALQLEQAAAIDPRLRVLAQRLDALRYEAEDVAAELRGYLDELAAEVGPQARLEQVEERLAVLARLARKHGGGIADVLAHAEHCRARRDELEHADEALERAESALADAQSELDKLTRLLSDGRRKAAPKLARAVRKRLAELAMPGARFEIELAPREECGPRGTDAIEILIAPNGGETLGPLREIASGGELSRVMLALLSVAQGLGTTAGKASPLLVFDEIDAGIGGHTARAVGEHLRTLAQGRQIICITHLPQVAALAERHFTIVKHAGSEPAITTVSMLEGDAVVGELVRMLGASEQDSAASQHARELLRAA